VSFLSLSLSLSLSLAAWLTDPAVYVYSFRSAMGQKQRAWGRRNVWTGLPVSPTEPDETMRQILDQWSAWNLARHWLLGVLWGSTASGVSSHQAIITNMAQQDPGAHLYLDQPRQTDTYTITGGQGIGLANSMNAITNLRGPSHQQILSGHTTTSRNHPVQSPRGYDLQTTNMVRVRDGTAPALTAAELQQRLLAGVSPAYRGDPNRPRNVSADIPEDENCAFWIEGLPPHCTVRMLLAAISGFGKIYATHLNPPNPGLNVPRASDTAAAKVIFFRLCAARAFFHAYEKTPLFVAGYFAIVKRNRVRVAELDRNTRTSRVLIITGPMDIVNWGVLQAAFRQKFVYEIDDVITLWEGGNKRSLEVRFGSARAQAEAAYQLLRPNTGPFANVCVWYGHDPCEPYQ